MLSGLIFLLDKNRKLKCSALIRQLIGLILEDVATIVTIIAIIMAIAIIPMFIRRDELGLCGVLELLGLEYVIISVDLGIIISNRRPLSIPLKKRDY